ncbi:toprim domain-containing protein [Aquifex sp.]
MEFKDLNDWIKKLKEFQREAVVLVEGKNDKRALAKFSIKNVIDLSGKRYADVVDILEGRAEKVILLFDLDPHGERINRKIKELLTSQGFEVIEDFRNFLKELNIIHIEDLDGEGKALKNS